MNGLQFHVHSVDPCVAGFDWSRYGARATLWHDDRVDLREDDATELVHFRVTGAPDGVLGFTWEPLSDGPRGFLWSSRDHSVRVVVDLMDDRRLVFEPGVVLTVPAFTCGANWNLNPGEYRIKFLLTSVESFDSYEHGGHTLVALDPTPDDGGAVYLRDLIELALTDRLVIQTTEPLVA